MKFNRFWEEVIFILEFALVMTLMSLCLCFVWDVGVCNMCPNLPKMPYTTAVYIVFGLFFICAGIKFCIKKTFEGRKDEDQ